MQAHEPKSAAQAHAPALLWQKRPVRILCGLLLFGGALWAESQLKMRVPVDFAEKGRFSPAVVNLGQEELIIEGPTVNSADGQLFARDGGPNEIVEVEFERARLAANTAKEFAALGDPVPDVPTEIKYLPQEAAAADAGRAPCSTFVKVWLDADHPPAALKLFQQGAPGVERYLEVQPTGGELTVELLPESPGDESAPEASGCPGQLNIGTREEALTEGFRFAVVAAADSTFRWHFRPRTQGPLPWGEATALFEPFTLGAPQAKETDAPPLRARAVRIRARGSDARAPDIFSARSTDGSPSLNLAGLKVGPNQLQLSVAGNGWMQSNGEDYTVSIFEMMSKSTLLTALNGALVAALLGLIARLIFGGRKPKSAGDAPT